MKTYSTYQEAKISNPECDIYHHPKGYFFPFEPRCYEALVSHCCNPADYCMTVEQFLEDGYKFVVGDVVEDFWGGVIIKIENILDFNSRFKRENKPEFILHAAALEKPKQISDTAREVFSTDSIPKLKRTKVEYVKVEESIFDLKYDFEAGELYVQLLGDSGEYRAIEEESALIDEVRDNNVYRRIETPMTEREAFIDAACAVNEEVHGERRQYIIESLFDSGKFKLVN